MTEPTQQERIDKLAEWMGWHRKYPGGPWWKGGVCIADWSWNPFVDLKHAHLLLLECDRRGLMSAVASEWERQCPYQIAVETFTPEEHYIFGIERGFNATPEQKTEAVWAVAKLERTNGTKAFNSEVGS